MFQASPVMKKTRIGFACLNIKVRRSLGVPPYWLLRVAVLINAAVTGMARRQMRGENFKPTTAQLLWGEPITGRSLCERLIGVNTLLLWKSKINVCARWVCRRQRIRHQVATRVDQSANNRCQM